MAGLALSSASSVVMRPSRSEVSEQAAAAPMNTMMATSQAAG